MKKLFAILFLLPLLAGAQTFTNAVIPLTNVDWYANDRIAAIDPLFDGDLNVANNYVPCFSMHVDTLQIVYDFPAAQHVAVRKIRIYDGQGSNTYPTKYYLKNASTGVLTLAGSFDGSSYDQWDSIVVSSPVENSQLIIKGGTGTNYGVEMQIVGDYTTYTRPTIFAPRQGSLFQNYLGVNSYWWDYQQDPNNPSDASHVVAAKFNRINEAFGLVRFFSDWVQWEVHRKQYAFGPLRDGWLPDSVFKRNYDNGINTLLCLQGIPTYMKASYVTPGYGDSTDYGPFHDYIPVIKGNYSQKESPASYLELAQLGWQIAARWGRNANIDTTLITLWDEAADGKGYYTPQTRKKGLATLKYICPWNENDKYWKGDSAYMTGRMEAAALSAFYDGNLNTMGAGVGVKNADSTMMVVASAFAVASVDHLRGMIDWCNDFRGGNLCWDIIDYHKYSTDNPDQFGNNHTGVAPEMGDAMQSAQAFVYTSNRYLSGMPVWITEHGYDTSQTSPFKAPPIGTMNKLQVQGAWLTRSALEYAAQGLQGTSVFQLFNDSQDPAAFSTQFETSGLLNQDATFSRRPVADYFKQAKTVLGNYTFSQRISTDVRVDKYVKSGSNDMYAMWVPDSLDRHSNYTLSVPTGTVVTIRQLKDGQDSPVVTTQTAASNAVTINVGEIPMIVEVPASIYGAPNRAIKFNKRGKIILRLR